MVEGVWVGDAFGVGVFMEHGNGNCIGIVRP